ncbi:MAG TPA: LysR substrate-binding domain-containing protein [Nevskiaceae bacterium]
MNLRDLQYLVALADHRHFRRAAQACFVSQPTLSMQVRKLEEELGAKLVERSSRRAMMTPLGAQVVSHARQVGFEVEQIRRLARRAHDPAAGSLRLGAFHTLAPYLFGHVIHPIRDAFPQLELLLSEEKTLELLDKLHTGKLDAALLALPVEDAALHAEFLFEEPFVLAVPEGHALERKRSVSVADLEGRSLLLLEDGHCLRDQALEVCQLAGASEWRDFRATGLETLCQMVAAKVGITLLPILSVQPPAARGPEVRLIPFKPPAPHRRIALCWRKTSSLAGFLPELASVFKALPPALLEPRGLRAAAGSRATG